MKQPCTKKIKRMQIRHLSQRETRVASCLTRDYIRIICECFRRACATESPCHRACPTAISQLAPNSFLHSKFWLSVLPGYNTWVCQAQLNSHKLFLFSLCWLLISLGSLATESPFTGQLLEALLQDHLFKSIYVGKPFCRTCCFSIEPCPVCWGLHPGPASAQLALHAASAQLAHNKHW